MGKTIVIGNASGYTWDQVKYWVNSLKKTDYRGDIALCVSNVSAETIRKFESDTPGFDRPFLYLPMETRM